MSEFIPRLTRLQAPAYLKTNWGLHCSLRTLARLATIGGGPAFRKAGRDVYYDISTLDAWAEKKLGSAAETVTAHRDRALAPSPGRSPEELAYAAGEAFRAWQNSSDRNTSLLTYLDRAGLKLSELPYDN